VTPSLLDVSDLISLDIVTMVNINSNKITEKNYKIDILNKTKFQYIDIKTNKKHEFRNNQKCAHFSTAPRDV
jgi:hypothetical protein